MASGVTFTIDDVEEKAGCEPWKTAEKFAEEIDEGEMTDASKAFAEAAGEASGAGDLASRASELTQDSGQDEYGSYHEAKENIEITDQALQGSGEDIESVADLINKSTDLALDTQKSVVDSYRDLTEKKQNHQDDAYDKLEEKQEALQTDLDEKNKAAASTPTGLPRTPSVTVNGTSYDADGSAVGGFTFPQAAMDAIREHYLGKAADDATTANGDITDEIDGYRAQLTKYATDMEDLGYDVADGPHDLWYSEEAADYYATQIEDELEKENPDQDKLNSYGNAVNEVATQDDLSPAEEQFLQDLYGGLSSESLADIGNLDPGEYGAFQTHMGNGVVAVSAENPPESVQHYLDGDALVVDQDQASLNESVRDVNGFGALVNSATVQPSDELANALFDSALETQLDYEGFYLSPHRDQVELTGTPEMLSAASNNRDASTEILGDGRNAELLLARDWSDEGKGAADVIRSATVPESGVPTQGQADAAKNVIDAAINAPEGTPEPGDELNMGIADMGVAHLNSMTRTGSDDGGRIDPWGNEMAGFSLTGSERQEFFQFIAAGGTEPQQKFAGGIDLFTYNMAHQAFSDDSPQREGAINDVLGQLGTLQGSFEHEMINYERQQTGEEESAEARAYKTWQTGSSAAFSALSMATGPVGTAAGWGGIANSLVNGFVPAPVPTSQESFGADQYQLVLDEGRQSRALIAQAAIDAGNTNADTAVDQYGFQNPTDGAVINYTDDDYLTVLNSVETELGYDVEKFRVPRNDVVLTEGFDPETANKDDE